MNLNKQQSVAIGVALIALGVVAWLNLWWLIWPGALVAAGMIGYTQRRNLGRTVEAVQIGLWMFGLAVLFLFGILWPGVLLLAGASFLIRGREHTLDERIQRFTAQLRSRRSAPSAQPAQQVPLATYQPQQQPTYQHVPVQHEAEEATTGETRRL